MSEFKQVINELRAYAFNDFIFSLVDSRAGKQIRNNLDYMEKCIEQRMENIEVTIEEERVREIRESLEDLTSAFIRTNFNEDKINFLRKYILLCHNWEQSMGGIESVYSMVETIVCIMEYQNSLVDAIYVLRHLTKEARGFMDFNPPSFEISQHYLKTIEERINGKR